MNIIQKVVTISLVTLLLMFSQGVKANPQMSGLELAEKVANRSSNKSRVGFMHFTMRNNAGSERKRSALVVHSQVPERTKIGIYFTEPAGLRDTSFLSHDNSASQDQNWLYLPATDRVRKLPSSSRGDYFMGTDLSYGDIKDNFKFALEDWDFSLGESIVENGKTYYQLKGVPKNEQIKAEIGYASFSAKIDSQTWFPIKIEYTDSDNTPLKEVNVVALDIIDETWTATHFTIDNSQLQHQTEIIISDMRAVTQVPTYLLTADELAYGAPLMLLEDKS
ncbi:outer membrane lipoprotein-sorting protein [Aliiglaciecola sp. NS0011-25]|uniref:outer membrane lipoprotein-sorting protein n=1 Tax=Aliiglaciecola sp. NS0011-25 TaxID=3127654 RepID=UPI0031030CAB